MVSDLPRKYQILLFGCQTDFEETWQEAIINVLYYLLFSDWFIVKDCRPDFW